ncbi:MAG: hypothetical protein KatS3mg129_3177 [Leptospiraceae bacterium]|nr:MAG: hypothetical protein KatS3mg129_3177 [Leptospiraceae bacterium]
MKKYKFIIIILLLTGCIAVEIDTGNDNDSSLTPFEILFWYELFFNPIPPEPDVDTIYYKATNHTGSTIIVNEYINTVLESNSSLKRFYPYSKIINNNKTGSGKVYSLKGTIKEFYIGVESLSLCSNPMTVDSDRYSKYDCEITASAINCVKMD